MSKRRIINFKSLKFAILRAIVLIVSLLSIVVIARDIAINTNRTEEQAKNSSSEIGN
jgi:hypothetical protein